MSNIHLAFFGGLTNFVSLLKRRKTETKRTIFMRFLVFMLIMFGMTPLSVFAQSADVLLRKVAEALSSGQVGYAVSLFRQSCQTDGHQAEMFYWTDVDKSQDTAPQFARELAEYFKGAGNYSKAYLFYKELLQYKPDSVEVLVSCAEMEVRCGQMDDAKETYEKVVALDPDNLQACNFLGSYYFLKSEDARRKLDADFNRLSAPTRMQYARYRNNLSSLFDSGYSKARLYLQQVLTLFPSSEVGKTLEKINLVEREVNR